MLNIKRSISRAQIVNGYENNIDESPDSQSAKAEQLADSLLPVTQVEP